MRKSKPTAAKSGNVAKTDSYAEAKARIKAAHAAGFYIESTALIESIVGDRILSYLHGKHQFSLRQKNGWHHSFSSLLKEVVKHSKLTNEKGECLWTLLDEWRNLRNDAVHGIVKSDPGKPTQPVSDFLLDAKKASTQGQSFLKEVLNWHKRELRNPRRSPA